MIISGCRRIVGGEAEGPALVTLQPINFLAMVDSKTGRLTDPSHDLYGKSLRGAVLVFPHSVGSSVGAYAIYSLAENGNGPVAVVCSKADITTASGCAIARIPVLVLPANMNIASMSQGTGSRIEVNCERETVKI